MKSRTILTAVLIVLNTTACGTDAVTQRPALGSVASVSPEPGSRTASTTTQISIRGVSSKEIGPVHVTGSRSGEDKGRLLAHSDGAGASYVVSKPFTPGETVVVRTRLNVMGSSDGSWRFVVAREQRTAVPTLPARATSVSSTSMLQSRPDLVPPVVSTTTTGTTAPGFLFIAPKGGTQSGPLIVDNAGHVVWFDPLKTGEADDFRAQTYRDKAVLTWFQGQISNGHGSGVDVIVDDTYHQIAKVVAGNGYNADLHEFQVTPQGTALITVYNHLQWDLSSIGGERKAIVLDGIVQEVDIATGLVLFEWHSLDHVGLDESYATLPRAATAFDYFHINSVATDGANDLLVSARNTHAVYEISRITGSVQWRLGGKRSDFAMGAGTPFAWQHDVHRQPNGDLTLFDNGADPKVEPTSRAIELRLDATKKTATLVRALVVPGVLATSQGNEQVLSDGDVVVGWGSQPEASEFGPSGTRVFDAKLPGAQQSYRAYRFTWAGYPSDAPAVSVQRGAGGAETAYASWNGATAIASWQVLSGTSTDTLLPVATVARDGFETAIHVPIAQPVIAVRALDASGSTLGASKPTVVR